MRTIAVASALCLSACGPVASRSPAASDLGTVRSDRAPTPDARFAAEAEAFYWFAMAAEPRRAVGLGYHQYDGTLPDVRPAALAERGSRLRAALAAFESMPGERLSRERALERQVLLVEIRRQLFDLEVRRAPHRDPMGYLWALDLAPYIIRDYAPIDERARAIGRMCDGSGEFLAQAAANLEPALPGTWIDTALGHTRGLIEFARNDVPAAMAALPATPRAQLDASVATCIAALEGYQQFLERARDAATDDYAIGAASMVRMLRDTEGVTLKLEELRALGEADLARNTAALEAAARAIDPDAETAAVIARVTADKPAADAVLEIAAAQAEAMHAFLIDREIVTIPSDQLVEVRDTPPYMRFNFAFLSGAGPFESEPLPSYYYITPPDASWPAKQQRDYIPFENDLLFVTVHEVWPGHFLQGLHQARNDSKILATFCSYATVEGWAHYAEEMMWDAGVGDGAPEVHIGQLLNALLRNVRFVAALGLHTGSMTVAEAEALFRARAFADRGNATQQAIRGTFDPGYLNYTLGKLMIRDLHDAWKAKLGDGYSLRGFHDALLSYGCAPIPVIRRFMLGEADYAAE